MQFRLYPLRFQFRAVDPVRFPQGSGGDVLRAANVFRGAMGLALRRSACGCGETETHQSDCLYARWFEPVGQRSIDSIPRDTLPRPFVLRARELDGKRFEPGEALELGMNWFDMQRPRWDVLEAAFRDMAATGFGPGRGHAELVAMEGGEEPLVLPLDGTSSKEALREIRVAFLTPTELKSKGELVEQPEFSIVIARVAKRIMALSELYDDGPLELDVAGLVAAAKSVKITRCDIRHVSQDRRSSRTGRVHPMGGFVGEVEYRGEGLERFLPLLKCAEWTGVGRQTSWGKGSIKTESAD